LLRTAIGRNDDITAALRRSEDHGPPLAADPRAPARKAGDDLHPVAVLREGSAHLRRRNRHPGNFVGGPADLSDTQRIQPFVKAHHPYRCHRYRLRLGGHAVGCGTRLRQLGRGAATPFRSRRIGLAGCSCLLCLRSCPHFRLFPFAWPTRRVNAQIGPRIRFFVAPKMAPGTTLTSPGTYLSTRAWLPPSAERIASCCSMFEAVSTPSRIAGRESAGERDGIGQGSFRRSRDRLIGEPFPWHDFC
jgi:hypothetical protein